MKWLRDEYARWDTTAEALRKFGALIGALLLLLGGDWFWRHHAGAAPALGAGGLVLCAGLLYPRLLRPLYLFWMLLAYVMGLVMTRVVLTLVFFMVVTPLALISRLLGKDQLGVRMRHDGPGTCWRARDQTVCTHEDYERQY